MNPKKLFIAGTVAFTIAISNGTGGSAAGAHPYQSSWNSKDKSDDSRNNDLLLEALGVASNEELHDALMNGRTLADIAHANGKDIVPVIRLQIAEMTEQLNLRLAAGTLAPERYEAHKSELASLITASTHDCMGRRLFSLGYSPERFRRHGQLTIS
jgi:hypothetical protein